MKVMENKIRIAKGLARNISSLQNYPATPPYIEYGFSGGCMTSYQYEYVRMTLCLILLISC